MKDQCLILNTSCGFDRFESNCLLMEKENTQYLSYYNCYSPELLETKPKGFIHNKLGVTIYHTIETHVETLILLKNVFYLDMLHELIKLNSKYKR